MARMVPLAGVRAELCGPCVGPPGRTATPVDPGQLGHLLAAGPARGAGAVPLDTQGIRQGHQGGVEEGAARRVREAWRDGRTEGRTEGPSDGGKANQMDGGTDRGTDI